jgi:uncharacterized membrane protein SirB2
MTVYLLIKYVHVAAATVSIVLFFVRGVWMLRASPLRSRRWARIVPHVNDSVLLLAAIILAVMSGQYPLRLDWLSAKLAALVLYILLGMVALRFGRTPGVRAGAFVAALLMFAYIVAVALTRRPLPWIGA